MPTDGIDDSSRRRILKSLGASAAVAGLAGCGGDGGGDTTNPTDTTTSDDTTTDDGTTTTDTTTTKGEPMKTAYHLQGPLPVPKTIQFNPYNYRNLAGLAEMNDQFATKIVTEQKWEPRIAEDWTFEGGRARININPDYVWTNGDKVTARDIEVGLEIEQHIIDMRDGERSWVGDWSVIDETTFEYYKKNADLNDTLFKQAILPTRLNTNRTIWEPVLEKLNEAKGTDSYEETLRNEVLSKKLGTDDLVTNGAWQLDAINGAQSVSFKPFPDNPRSENISEDVEKFVLPDSSGREEAFASLRNGKTDGTMNSAVPEQVVEQMPDYTTPVVTDGYGGGCLFFQFDDPWYSKRPVRKAIAYATNWHDVATNAGRAPPDGSWTGITNTPMKLNWYGQEMLDSVENYKWSGRNPGIEKSTAMERAKNYMREAGLEMGEDWWVKPDGEPLKAPIHTISGWTTAVVFLQTIVDNLRNFGLKATSNPTEGSTFWNQTWGKGKFRMANGPTTGGGSHPYYAYNTIYDQDSPESRANKVFNLPTKVDIPMPIGDREGATETFDPDELVDELRVTSDLEKQRTIVKKLGWITNQQMTVMPNNKEEAWPWYSTDVWQMPEPVENWRDPPNVYRNFGHRELIERGLMKPKYE